MSYRLASLILVILLGFAPTAQAGTINNVKDPAQLIKLRQSFEKRQRETYRNNLKNYKKQLDVLERKYQQKNASVDLFSVRAEKRKIIKDLESFASPPTYKKAGRASQKVDSPTSKPAAPKTTVTKNTPKVKTEPKPVLAKNKPTSKPKIKAVAFAKRPATIAKAQPVAASKAINKPVAKVASPVETAAAKATGPVKPVAKATAPDKPVKKTSVAKKSTAKKLQTKKITMASPQKATMKPLPLVAISPKAATTLPITVAVTLPKTTKKLSATAKTVAQKPLARAKPVPIKKREPIVHASDINGIAGSPAFSVHNTYKFKLASIGLKSTLKYYAAGRRTINSIGKVWLIDKDGKKTMLHKWTAKDFAMPAMEAKNYKDLTPTIIDITPQVTAPGEYKIEFDYIDGIDALGILRVEITS